MSTRFIAGLTLTVTVVLLAQSGSRASAPGITFITQAFATDYEITSDAPIMAATNVAGLFFASKTVGQQCPVMMLMAYGDPDRVLTIGGNSSTAGYEIARRESGVFDTMTQTCDTESLASTQLEITIGPGAIGATVLGNGHTRIVVPMLRSEGGCAYINQLGGPECVPGNGATDFNGDGDPMDWVLAYRVLDLDPVSKVVTAGALVTTSVQADNLSASTDGTTIASLLTESTVRQDCYGTQPTPPNRNCPGDLTPGADLDGDTYIGASRALRLYDTTAESPAVVYSGLSHTQSGGTCPRPAHVNDFRDTLPTQNVFIASGIVVFESDEQAPADAVVLDPGGVAECSSPAKPGRDDNEDGDYNDRVARWFAVGTPGTVHVGPTLADRTPSSTGSIPMGVLLLGTDGVSIAYTVQEEGSGFEMPPNCTDLTHDCDNSDIVLHVYTIATDAVTNTGAATSEGLLLPGSAHQRIANGMVSVLFGEGADAMAFTTQDVNGDGDTQDTMLRLYDIDTATVINTQVAMVDRNSSGVQVEDGYLAGTDGVTVAYLRTIFTPVQAPGDFRYIKIGDGVTQPGGAGGAPFINWSNPMDITAGTPLSGTQLNANINPAVAGTFEYTPAEGTVLAAGAGQALNVVFTPQDTETYTTSNKTVFINVLEATAANITGEVTVTRGGFRLMASGRFRQSVTLRKSSGPSNPGPVSLVLDSLSPNATLYQPAGTTSCTTPAGSSYAAVNVGADVLFTLNEQVTLIVEFVNPSRQAITYVPRVLAGTGCR